MRTAITLLQCEFEYYYAISKQSDYSTWFFEGEITIAIDGQRHTEKVLFERGMAEWNIEKDKPYFSNVFSCDKYKKLPNNLIVFFYIQYTDNGYIFEIHTGTGLDTMQLQEPTYKLLPYEANNKLYYRYRYQRYF